MRNFFNIKSAIALFRIQQWSKNGFIFLPLFFGRKLTYLPELINTLFAFIAFSFITSSIYCLNDLIDVEDDRLHPKKCKRPIASGLISENFARFLIILLIISSVFILFAAHLPIQVSYIILIYFIMNIAYCLKLKQIAIVDVMIISIGFVLRLFVGASASGVRLSHWIVIMTFLLALFLAFAKRRDDYQIFLRSGVKLRSNILRYSSEYINTVLSVIIAVVLVSYIMYTVSPEVISSIGSDYIYITSIFVVLGLLRYLQITIVDEKSGSPTDILFKDRFVQLSILGWILAFAYFLYL